MEQINQNAPRRTRRSDRALRLAGLIAATAVIGTAACKSKDKTNWVYSTATPWPTRVIMPPNDHGFFFTTNNLSDTVSVVDAETLQPLTYLPVGLNPVELEGPHHLQPGSDGKYLYVGLTETFPSNASGPHGAHGTGAVPGYLLKIRISDGELVGKVRVDRNPGDVKLSPDASKVYVSHFDVKRIIDQTQAGGDEQSKWSGIAQIDTATMTRDALVMNCPAEHGMDITHDGSTMYVACYGGDEVAIVDLTQPDLPSTLVPAGTNPIELPGTQSYQPYATTLNTSNTLAWFSCWASGDVRALDTATGQFDDSKKTYLGGYPTFGAAWHGDRMVFARQSGTPGVFDDHVFLVGSNGGVVADYAMDPSQCKNAHQVMIDPKDSNHAIVCCEGDHVNPGSLVRMDLQTGAVLATAQVGVFPDLVVYVPPGGTQ